MSERIYSNNAVHPTRVRKNESFIGCLRCKRCDQRRSKHPVDGA